MLRKLNWQAYSSGNRHEIIDALKAVIMHQDGYILSFNTFSDLTLSMMLEIEERHITNLHQALSRIVKVSDLEADKINPSSKKEWFILINLSFSKGQGLLKNKIPEVPG